MVGGGVVMHAVVGRAVMGPEVDAVVVGVAVVPVGPGVDFHPNFSRLGTDLTSVLQLLSIIFTVP